MPRSIANTSSPSVLVTTTPAEAEAYSGMIFGWRPPASCYGSGSKTPQQKDCGPAACASGNQFLYLLAGAAVLGLVVRK